MNDLVIFQNSGFGSLRTIAINSEPWFVGKDVAKMLGYSNPRKALLDHVDQQDKTDGVTIRDSIGREQKPVLINESGLYSLILSSKLPSAQQFRHWVTHDVLPAIRRTGSYSSHTAAVAELLSDPNALILVLQQLSNEHAARISAENAQLSTAQQLLAAQQQLTETQATLNRKTLTFIPESEASKHHIIPLHKFADHIHFPRNQFYAWLRRTGYLSQTSQLPTPMALQSGYLCIIEKHSGNSRYYIPGITLTGQLMYNIKHNK